MSQYDRKKGTCLVASREMRLKRHTEAMERLMDLSQSKMPHLAVMWIVVLSIGVLIAGTAIVYKEFGLSVVLMLVPLLAAPVVIAASLLRKATTIRAREATFLTVLFCITSGASFVLAHRFYGSGLHWDRIEDRSWAEFERRLQSEPAFQDIRIHPRSGKGLHWASGELPTKSDLSRLMSIAAECGIDHRRLDGSCAPGITLFVKGEPRP